HYIEGGWPGSNPRDMQFFDLAKRTKFANATITAFGSTRKAGITPADDQNLVALLESDTPAVTIFGKTWDLHVEKVIKTTREENLSMIYDSVEFLKKNDREVIYDAEHFFDGYKSNRDYALKTLKTALDAGAEFLVLCDTNGGTLPYEVEAIMADVQRALSENSGPNTDATPVKYGIHTHNDSGLAVANSISAIQSGAVMVQGTINGYGERCGNADLISIIPILCLKMNRPSISDKNLAKLKTLSRFVSQTANIVPLNSRPFVGESAFAHKGGIHVNAVMKISRAYEHMNPERVGNRRRVLISDLSGKSNIEYKIKELGIDLAENGLDTRKIVSEIKRMEHEGYQFEAADGSLKILMEKFADQFQPMFDLESFRVIIEKNKDQPCNSQATIEISVGGKTEITAAKGKGPVSALDNALRKALESFYRTDLDTMRLVDYKVRVIEGREGTGARVRVMLESRDKDDIWRTIGVSHDIIEASWHALEDSFQYKLSKENTK
ncbi:MAG: citramalate synthase, partial [Deltaproteobacteria bacterium]|nr:citramalate synthase [Deltaproteobacteria bacterium]